jgi:excisionase family DNA binding protein
MGGVASQFSATFQYLTSMDRIMRARESVPDGMLISFYRAYKADIEFLSQQADSRRPRAKSNRSDSVEPRALKTNEAAAYLGISPWKLRNLVQSGEISYISGEGTSPWLFDKQELDRWIESRKQKL